MNSLRKFLFVDPLLPNDRPLFKSCAEIVNIYNEKPNGVIMTERKVTSFMKGVSFSPKNSPNMKKGLAWTIDNKLTSETIEPKFQRSIHDGFNLRFDDWNNQICKRVENSKKDTHNRFCHPTFLQNISYGSYTSVVTEKGSPANRILLYLDDSILNTPHLQCEYLMRTSDEVFIFLPAIPSAYFSLLAERIVNLRMSHLSGKRTRILSLRKDSAEKFFDEYGIWWNEKKLTIARESLEIRYTEKWLGDKIIIVARPRRRTWYDEFSFRYEDRNIFKHEQNNKPYIPELMETYSHAKIYTKPNL